MSAKNIKKQQNTKGLYRTDYMSEIDIFLREFDENRKTLPASRIQEVNKHLAVVAKRDGIVLEDTNVIWKEF